MISSTLYIWERRLQSSTLSYMALFLHAMAEVRAFRPDIERRESTSSTLFCLWTLIPASPRLNQSFPPWFFRRPPSARAHSSSLLVSCNYMPKTGASLPPPSAFPAAQDRKESRRRDLCGSGRGLPYPSPRAFSDCYQTVTKQARTASKHEKAKGTKAKAIRMCSHGLLRSLSCSALIPAL